MSGVNWRRLRQAGATRLDSAGTLPGTVLFLLGCGAPGITRESLLWPVLAGRANGQQQE
ncbi:MAG: hypothetical protein ACLQKY_10530 [Terracidiphilus sp.]